MSFPVYGLAFVVSAIGIALILRVFVRRDYLLRGGLRPISVILQYLMVFIWVAFGWLNIPPRWPTIIVPPIQEAVGWVFLLGGLIFFGAAMLKLGIGNSHGVPDGGVQQAGLYRWTRNPQILGFGTFLVGFTLLWPTWRMAGVYLLFMFLAHLMVLTEEEFLRHQVGKEYDDYCRRVPRYLGLGRG